MGLLVTGSKRLLAVKEFRYNRRGYLSKVLELLDKHFTMLSDLELHLVRSLVFPVDVAWSPTTQLEKKIVEAIKIVKERPDIIVFHARSITRIKKKLSDWNSLCKLKRPEFVRKVEGVNCHNIRPRELKQFGNQYYYFVCLCAKHEHIPALKVIKKTISEMSKKKWQGVITPKICLCLTGVITQSDYGSGSKLKELQL